MDTFSARRNSNRPRRHAFARLNVFFYKSDLGAFFYTLFGEINPFNMWLYGVMGYLLAEIYKLKQGGVYGILFGLWLLLALLTSSFALLGEKLSPVQ